MKNHQKVTSVLPFHLTSLHLMVIFSKFDYIFTFEIFHEYN